MATDDDVKKANDKAVKSQDTAEEVRQEAIDGHRQAANSEEEKADELE